jgi:hypothetical protein
MKNHKVYFRMEYTEPKLSSITNEDADAITKKSREAELKIKLHSSSTFGILIGLNSRLSCARTGLNKDFAAMESGASSLMDQMM